MLDSVRCPEKEDCRFFGGAGHGLKTSMYGKKVVLLCCYCFFRGADSWCLERPEGIRGLRIEFACMQAPSDNYTQLG